MVRTMEQSSAVPGDHRYVFTSEVQYDAIYKCSDCGYRKDG